MRTLSRILTFCIFLICSVSKSNCQDSNAPTVVINQPQSGSFYLPGSMVPCFASASEGCPDYTYYWSLLGQTQEGESVVYYLDPDTTPLGTITLSVTAYDSNNVASTPAYATIITNVSSPSQPPGGGGGGGGGTPTPPGGGGGPTPTPTPSGSPPTPTPTPTPTSPPSPTHSSFQIKIVEPPIINKDAKKAVAVTVGEDLFLACRVVKGPPDDPLRFSWSRSSDGWTSTKPEPEIQITPKDFGKSVTYSVTVKSDKAKAQSSDSIELVTASIADTDTGEYLDAEGHHYDQSGNPVTTPEKDVLVGQTKHFELSLNGASIELKGIKWTVGGSPFEKWNYSSIPPKIQKLQISNTTIDPCWNQPANMVPITCSILTQGGNLDVTTVIGQIISPQFKADLYLNDVFVTNKTLNNVPPTTFTPGLVLGDANHVGMYTNFVLRMPTPPDGQTFSENNNNVSFVQVIDHFELSYRLFKTVVQEPPLDDTLDSTGPFPYDKYNGHDNLAVDNPGINLAASGAPNYVLARNVTVEYKFTMFYMFKPNGESNYVTLANCDWKWRGTAYFHSQGNKKPGVWSLQSPPDDHTITPVSATLSTEFPTWKGLR